MPEFRGLKVAWEGARLEYPDNRKVKIAPGERGEKFADRIILNPGTIGGGGNSGFQALNLALQWGARRVLLVGFDMTDGGGLHWYGRNRWPQSSNPNSTAFRGWITTFERSVATLRAIGAEVVNCSPNSALTCFPKMTIEEALAAWGL